MTVPQLSPDSIQPLHFSSDCLINVSVCLFNVYLYMDKHTACMHHSHIPLHLYAALLHIHRWALKIHKIHKRKNINNDGMKCSHNSASSSRSFMAFSLSLKLPHLWSVLISVGKQKKKKKMSVERRFLRKDTLNFPKDAQCYWVVPSYHWATSLGINIMIKTWSGLRRTSITSSVCNGQFIKMD